MSPSEMIAKVRELDKAATPKPWTYDAEGEWVWTKDGTYLECHICDMRGVGANLPIAANAALITEFRTLAPLLATELEKALERERILREGLEWIAKHEGYPREMHSHLCDWLEDPEDACDCQSWQEPFGELRERAREALAKAAQRETEEGR